MHEPGSTTPSTVLVVLGAVILKSAIALVFVVGFRFSVLLAGMVGTAVDVDPAVTFASNTMAVLNLKSAPALILARCLKATCLATK